VNTEDADVVRFLKLYTFLPLEEIAALGHLQGADIRRAKEVLAYEVTRLTHGEAHATAAREAARQLFGGAGSGEGVPSTTLSAADVGAGMLAVELFERAGLSKSRSEARRLIQQGGAFVNDELVATVEAVITPAMVRQGALLLRAGKKRFHRVVIE
jgi:tyrosyl-tRNA synthetase